MVVDAAFQTPVAEGYASYYIRDTIIPSAHAELKQPSSLNRISTLTLIAAAVAMSSTISLCIFLSLKLSHAIIVKRRMEDAHGQA